MLTLLCLGLLVSVCRIVFGGTDAEMRTLLNAKLNSSDYSPRVRPIKDTGNVLTLTVDMHLVAINGVDEVEQKITTTAFMKIVWADTFMTWTPADYGGITEYTLPQENIWKPDLALANAYDTITGLGDPFMYLTVTYDGNITWEPFQVFESTCSLDMTNFPFDKQKCDIQLVTWSSTSDMIRIVTGNDGFSIDSYEENANWYLQSVSTFDSSTASTSGLSFSINIKRKPVYYLLNFMIPIVLLSILNNFVFILPCDSGEKSGYAMVLFLSFAIFLLIVTEIMPEGMNTIPVMSSYLLIECIFSTMIVFLTIVELRLHNQGDDTPIPNALKVLTNFVKKVKRKICYQPGKLDNDRYSEADSDETPVKIPLETFEKKADDKKVPKEAAITNQEKSNSIENKELTTKVKRKLCCGASKASNDNSEMWEVIRKDGSSEVATELDTSSAKTEFKLSDVLGTNNRVAPEAFFSKPTSVEPIYDQTLSVEDVDEVDEIMTKPAPKMANVQVGLRQTGSLRPPRTPEPKVAEADKTSIKSSDGEDVDEMTWTEVVLALDNLLFVLFLIIKTIATVIAFSVPAAS